VDYDLVVVGGGLAGSSLGIALARRGARVLIVEREAAFKDRVRGEGMLPWGVAEARTLGIHQPLIDGCSRDVRWWTTPQGRRDLHDTSPSGLGCLNFYHPEMQQLLLAIAVEAGCEVHRPAEVTDVIPGSAPMIVVRSGGVDQRITARLVVGADGRNSRVRAWSGLSVMHEPDCLVIAGALFHGIDLPEDSIHVTRMREAPEATLIFPIGAGRFRTYFVSRHGAHTPLSGSRSLSEFTSSCIRTGAPSDWFRSAVLGGPIASFSGAETWVEQPYREGVTLIGDAAATSDPAFGCGLSLSLRDVRVLRDHLLAQSDWDAAARAYAVEHDRYYTALHRVVGWWRDFFYGVGPEAEAIRARALPKIAKDPSRVPDIVGLGPDAPHDEAARCRFHGED
jgi:2-polyprenyl-6-methoxyphenol hydroxylase-like FAD-dependent oxidoreductase